jgi:hypothetical protein
MFRKKVMKLTYLSYPEKSKCKTEFLNINEDVTYGEDF